MEYPCQNWHSLSRLTWKMRKNRVSRNRCNVACSWSWFARSTVSISQQQSSIFAGPVSNATTRRTTPAPAYLRRRNGDDSGSDNHQQRTATHYVTMTRVLPHPGGTCRARGPKSPLPTPGRRAPICRRFRVFDPPQAGPGRPERPASAIIASRRVLQGLRSSKSLRSSSTIILWRIAAVDTKTPFASIRKPDLQRAEGSLSLSLSILLRAASCNLVKSWRAGPWGSGMLSTKSGRCGLFAGNRLAASMGMSGICDANCEPVRVPPADDTCGTPVLNQTKPPSPRFRSRRRLQGARPAD